MQLLCHLPLQSMLHWLTHTDAGLFVRISVGSAIFVMLAAVDLYRHGKSATRWREYTVLIVAVVAALCYGTINDQITVTISPEYFLYGKELFRSIGDKPPPATLRFEAAKIGLKATWTVGLIFGVVLLLANNPMRSLPRLRNWQLLFYIPMILATATALGTLGGFLGYHGSLTRFDTDFADMVAANVYRPRRFMAAWGVHLGGYVGGLAGTLLAVGRIQLIRQRMRYQRVANAV